MKKYSGKNSQSIPAEGNICKNKDWINCAPDTDRALLGVQNFRSAPHFFDVQTFSQGIAKKEQTIFMKIKFTLISK